MQSCFPKDATSFRFLPGYKLDQCTFECDILLLFGVSADVHRYGYASRYGDIVVTLIKQINLQAFCFSVPKILYQLKFFYVGLPVFDQGYTCTAVSELSVKNLLDASAFEMLLAIKQTDRCRGFAGSEVL